MIKRYKHNLSKSIFLIMLLIGSSHASEHISKESLIIEPKGSQYGSKTRKNVKKNHGWFEFLTDINVALEAASIHGGDYVAKTSREVQFDALKIGNLNFHFEVQEQILFDSSPRQLDHVLNYIKVGYETFNGRIIAFWDHTCNNPSRELEIKERNGIHWNELGIGYEANGMMLGHKSDSITFNADSEWLNNIYWKTLLSKIWMRTENNYEWMLKLSARDDLFRAGKHVLYVQTDFDLIYDHRGINFNSNLEVGDRYHLNEHAYLITFFAYEHFDDWYALDHGEDLFSAGLSLEMALGRESDGRHLQMKERNNALDLDFSITGGYTNILDNDKYGHSSDFAIDLNLLNPTPDMILGLNTYVGIVTIPDDLNPYWIEYKIGPSLGIDLNEWCVDIFYSYSSLYSLETDKSMRNYHRLAFEITENILTQWDISLGIGAYPSTSNFDYHGEIFGNLTLKLNPKGINPYVSCSGKYLEGSRDLSGYALEAGIDIPGERGNFNIYWRQQDDIDVFRFKEGKQTFLGIRFGF